MHGGDGGGGSAVPGPLPTLGVPGGLAQGDPKAFSSGGGGWGAAEPSGSWALEERRAPGLEGGAQGKRRCDMPRAPCRERGECFPELDCGWKAG